jgi:hypothetical protein
VDVVLAGVPSVEDVLAGVPVEAVPAVLPVVPVVDDCVVAVPGLVCVPTVVGVPTLVGVPTPEEVAPDVVGVAVVPAAPVGLLMEPPVVCATIQQERARTVASKIRLRVRM